MDEIEATRDRRLIGVAEEHFEKVGWHIRNPQSTNCRRGFAESEL